MTCQGGNNFDKGGTTGKDNLFAIYYIQPQLSLLVISISIILGIIDMDILSRHLIVHWIPFISKSLLPLFRIRKFHVLICHLSIIIACVIQDQKVKMIGKGILMLGNLYGKGSIVQWCKKLNIITVS